MPPVVAAGRKTEVERANGAVVALGEREGVDASVNRTLTALVRGLERGYLST